MRSYKLIIFSLIMLAVVITACNTGNIATCNLPNIDYKDGCCADLNSNNICDALESTNITVNDTANVPNSTVAANMTINDTNATLNVSTNVNASINVNDNVSNNTSVISGHTEPHPTIISQEISLNDYLSIFKNKETYIVYDLNSLSPVIIASINLQGYFAFSSNIHVITTDDANANVDNNLILLGSPCKNKLTNKILGLDNDSCGFLSEKQGQARMFKKDGKYILLIMSSDEKYIPQIAKQLIDGTPYSGEIKNFDFG